jgi:hypothetical protein
MQVVAVEGVPANSEAAAKRLDVIVNDKKGGGPAEGVGSDVGAGSSTLPSHGKKVENPLFLTVRLAASCDGSDLGGDSSMDRTERNRKVYGMRVEDGEVALPTLLDLLDLPGALLVGLHACGDLTADCCRMFKATPQLAGMVMCGCCYGLISEPGNLYVRSFFCVWSWGWRHVFSSSNTRLPPLLFLSQAHVCCRCSDRSSTRIPAKRFGLSPSAWDFFQALGVGNAGAVHRGL